MAEGAETVRAQQHHEPAKQPASHCMVAAYPLSSLYQLEAAVGASVLPVDPRGGSRKGPQGMLHGIAMPVVPAVWCKKSML